MDSPTPRPNRLVLAGGVAALLAGALIAGVLLSGGRGEKPAPPPASQAGLVIDTASGDKGRIDPAKALRCFVAGQFVGDLTLVECARRNGVATDALDVGVDPTGALAAAQQASPLITPLPPQEPAAAPAPAEAVPVAAPALQPAASAPGSCWRYGSGQWRKLPADMDLNACVQALFAGRCERPGGATYGRWAQETVRLVTGKVEVSSDNQNFHLLAAQGPGCSIPPA